MLLGTSTGAEDDLDVSNGNGIGERRRSAIFKNRRMVKIEDKDKGKVKPCKTIIIQEDPPPALPASGKQLADVIAPLSSEELGLVIGHLPSSTVQNGSCKVASPRCDPNGGQRGERDAAPSPRCDSMHGQWRKQQADVHFNDAGKEFDRRTPGSRPSGMASMLISSASALKVTRSSSCSSPQFNSGGAGLCKTSSGRASSPVASGVGALLRPWFRFAKGSQEPRW